MMMKRMSLAVICLCLIIALTSCGQQQAVPSEQQPAPTAAPTAAPTVVSTQAPTDTPVPESTDAPTEAPVPESTDAPADAAAVPSYDHIDWDLTNLSSYMVYAQIFNMAASPDTYQGQVVRMKGTFDIGKGAAPDGGDTYSLVTYDEEACCTQAVALDFAQVDKLPKKGRDATVTGIFTAYRENGANYCRLENAVLN